MDPVNPPREFAENLEPAEPRRPESGNAKPSTSSQKTSAPRHVSRGPKRTPNGPQDLELTTASDDRSTKPVRARPRGTYQKACPSGTCHKPGVRRPNSQPVAEDRTTFTNVGWAEKSALIVATRTGSRHAALAVGHPRHAPASLSPYLPEVPPKPTHQPANEPEMDGRAKTPFLVYRPVQSDGLPSAVGFPRTGRSIRRAPRTVKTPPPPQ
jgi:hypothetical protein